jgi:dUTP pyrophosphatase
MFKDVKPPGLFVNNSNIENQLCKNRYSDAGQDLRVDLHKEITLYSKAGEMIIDDPELDEICLPAMSRIVLNTSLNISVPSRHVGLIWDRSGLAAKHGLTILAGCVDEGYVGDVKVVVFNSSWIDYYIKHGDKIAQLLTIPVDQDQYVEVESLEETNRGSNGFNSSGYS